MDLNSSGGQNTSHNMLMLLCVSWMCKRTSEPSPYNCAFLRLTNYSAHLIKSSLYNTQTSICITLWWAATIGENLCLFISMLFNHKVTAFVLTVKTVGILTAVKLSLCCWLIWKITSFSGCMLTPCPAYWSIALLCNDWRVCLMSVRLILIHMLSDFHANLWHNNHLHIFCFSWQLKAAVCL